MRRLAQFMRLCASVCVSRLLASVCVLSRVCVRLVSRLSRVCLRMPASVCVSRLLASVCIVCIVCVCVRLASVCVSRLCTSVSRLLASVCVLSRVGRLISRLSRVGRLISRLSRVGRLISRLCASVCVCSRLSLCASACGNWLILCVCLRWSSFKEFKGGGNWLRRSGFAVCLASYYPLAVFYNVPMLKYPSHHLIYVFYHPMPIMPLY